MKRDAARSVVVVGAGVAGLSFAYHALRRTPDLDLTVLDEAPRVGGNVRTLRRDGCTIELGPDAFLAMDKSAATALCDALGLGALISPAQSRVLVARGSSLHPLPEGLAMGLPRSFSQMAGTPLLSPWGKLRAGIDLFLPAHREAAVSVGELVGRRLGREVKERLVEPIVGGIYGGDVDELDAHVVMPSLAKVKGSLIRAMATAPRPPSGGATPLRAPKDGIDTLTDALAREVGSARIRLSTKAIALVRRGDGWTVRCEDGRDFDADAVVLASPPPVIASLVGPLDAGAAEALNAFKLRAAMTVIAVFDRGQLRAPEASGALIPRSVDEPLRALTALSFVDRKWPDRVRDDTTVIRLAVRPERALQWMDEPDDAIVARALAALRVLLPAPEPRWTAVERYGQGTPQPTPGHIARVAAARAKVDALGGISLAGATWDGPGIAGCIAGAQRLAERLAGVTDSRGA